MHRTTYEYLLWCVRYRAMAHVERDITTEPHGWVDIALQPETAYDACETAFWLENLSRRIPEKYIELILSEVP